MSDRLYTIKECAELLDCSERYIRLLIYERKELEYVKIADKVHIPESVLQLHIDKSKMLTTSDLQKRFGVSRQRIHQYMDAGRLEPSVTYKGRYYFTLETIRKFEEENPRLRHLNK